MDAEDTLMMEPLAREPTQGDAVNGYILGRLLGRGAHGAVYLATRLGQPQTYALKVINTHGHPPDFTERILRECRITTALRHPGLITVHEAGRWGDSIFIAMDLAVGRPANEFSDGRLGWELALGIARQVALALDHAYRTARVIHRDIKPANIVVEIASGTLRTVKVVDFGLSRAIDDQDHGLTMTGAILGTPFYMSPEQARGERDLGFATDLYALGATLFHLVAGRPPFNAGQAVEILLQHCNQAAPRLDAVRPGCPREVADLVARCLEKSPAARWRSYGEFIAACDSLLHAEHGDPFDIGDDPRPAPAARPGPVPTSKRYAHPLLPGHDLAPSEDARGASTSNGADALGELFRTKLQDTSRQYRRPPAPPTGEQPRWIPPSRDKPPQTASHTRATARTPAQPPQQPQSQRFPRMPTPLPTPMEPAAPPAPPPKVPTRFATPLPVPPAEATTVQAAAQTAAAPPVTGATKRVAQRKPPSVATGTVLAGDYTVLGPLGAGAMGEVYTVRERLTDRELALKILSSEDMLRPGAVRRFQGEASALATVEHPAFPFFAGKGTHDGRDYLLMERVHGIDLRAFMAEKGPLGEQQALWVVGRLADAMDRAYAKCGMVHRDIKPANLMFSRDDAQQLKIVDFGVSTYIDYGDYEDFSEREYRYIDDDSQGRAVGTPAYMSPEQCSGQPPSPLMDIYAIGCTFFHLLTGRTPFSAPHSAAMMMKHLQEQPPDLESVVQVSSGSAYLFKRCLAKKPADRFRNYKQLAAAVDSASFSATSRIRRKGTNPG